MPVVGCLIAWTYCTQAVDRTRSAAAISAGLAAARLSGGGLDLRGQLRPRCEAVERRALKDRDQLRDRRAFGAAAEPDRLRVKLS